MKLSLAAGQQVRAVGSFNSSMPSLGSGLSVQATLHPDVQFIEVLRAHPVPQFFCVCGRSTAVFLEHIQHGFQPLQSPFLLGAGNIIDYRVQHDATSTISLLADPVMDNGRSGVIAR